MSPEPALVLVPSRDRRRDVVSAMRREFTRWPRLSLTLAQARRLWSLETTTCRELLGILLDEGALTQRADGTYVSVLADFRRQPDDSASSADGVAVG